MAYKLRHLAVLVVSIILFCDASYAMPTGVSKRTLRKTARKGVDIAALSDVCSSVSDLENGEFLVKYPASDHISNGDARKPGLSTICASECPARIRAGGAASVFYVDGTLAAKQGYYGRWNGNGQPRAYCASGGAPACNARSIAAKARRKGESCLYMQTSSATSGSSTTCKKFCNILGRNGGV